MPCVVAIDIEATGMDHTRHAMLEIGAVAVDIDTFEVVDRFLVTLRHDQDPRWETRCLREFWTDPAKCSTPVVHSLLDRIRDSGVTPTAAITQLLA
jgi:oligoribonuclease (3'-5' exoribonuclease)